MKNWNQKAIILIASVFLFSACQQVPSAGEPEPDLNGHLQNSKWSINFIEISTKDFKGSCDFSKAHPNDFDEAVSGPGENARVQIRRMSFKDPNGCRFQTVAETGAAVADPALRGVFEVQIKGASTIELKYQAQSAAVGSPRQPAMAKIPSGPLIAHCSKFETKGLISLRQRLVSCFLPQNQGMIRLEERD